MRLPQFATIATVIALVVSSGGLYVAKRSLDLSATKDERELRDKRPAIDVQIHPNGASSASVVISIINRADINITPLYITVEHSFEAGDLYLSNTPQSLDLLRSSLNLKAMGTIAPKGTSTLKLSITHISGRSDFRAEFDIGKSREAAPDDDVSRWGVASSGQIAAQSCELDQVECKGS
ncbi:hypothetical protein V1281_000140 [Nitrobacteraceae bacterium AZCC 2161]